MNSANVTADMLSTLSTLRTLCAASRKCFTLDLHDAYRAAPRGHVAALVKAGLWYQGSATQGNLTEKGLAAMNPVCASYPSLSALVSGPRLLGAVKSSAGCCV